MCFIHNIIAQLHSQCWGEQLSVAYCCGCIPDLNDVKLTLWRQCHTYNGIILVLEHSVGKAMDHTIDEDLMGLRRVNLLGPRAALVVLGCIPQRTIPIAHQKEHARIPGFRRDGFDNRPELGWRIKCVDLNVTLQRIVVVVGVVIPQTERICEVVCHLILWGSIPKSSIVRIRFENGFLHSRTQ